MEKLHYRNFHCYHINAFLKAAAPKLLKWLELGA